MFWETLWALVLGFSLSGAVQAFVSRGGCAAAGRPPPPLARAGFSGVPRPARTRRRAGQDAVRPRRGLHRLDGVHVRLDQPRGRAGHRAVAADRLAVRRGRVRRRRHHDRALRCCCPGCQPAVRTSRAALPRTPRRTAPTTPPATEPLPSPARARQIRSLAVVGRAATRSRPDDAAQGARDRVLVAGSLAVPCRHVWRALFLTGHGFWTARERDPRPVRGDHQLRLLDRQRRAGRGAVDRRDQLRRCHRVRVRRPHHVPLLLIYRRYYGGRLTLRLLAAFWSGDERGGARRRRGCSCSVSVLPTHSSGAPGADGSSCSDGDLRARTSRRSWERPSSGWLARHQVALGRRAALPSLDPVCGMQVERSVAPASYAPPRLARPSSARMAAGAASSLTRGASPGAARSSPEHAHGH